MAKRQVRVPKIADYELRRELLRQGKQKSIDRLNKFSQICLILLTPETMRKAAELWAWVRNLTFHGMWKERNGSPLQLANHISPVFCTAC